jgi:N-acetyl-gamma-glutamyl-phosphate reductase
MCVTSYHTSTFSAAGELGAKAPKILDASTAHRVAPGWVYGFAELAEGLNT